MLVIRLILFLGCLIYNGDSGTPLTLINGDEEFLRLFFNSLKFEGPQDNGSDSPSNSPSDNIGPQDNGSDSSSNSPSDNGDDKPNSKDKASEDEKVCSINEKMEYFEQERNSLTERLSDLHQKRDIRDKILKEELAHLEEHFSEKGPLNEEGKILINDLISKLDSSYAEAKSEATKIFGEMSDLHKERNEFMDRNIDSDEPASKRPKK